MQYSRDTIHTYPVAELGVGGGGGAVAPSLDPPMYTYFIATPYKGFQSQDYIPITLK